MVPWKLVSHPLPSQRVLIGGARLRGLVLGHTQTQIDRAGGRVGISVAMAFIAGCGCCWKVRGVGVRCDGLVRVARGERVTRSCPSARYSLASRGGCIPLPSRIRAELLALRWELVFPAGELLCAQTKGWGCRCLPLFSSCPGAPASDGKKPLEARLSNGWSGINAQRGLCSPRRPFGDGGGLHSPVPRVLC